MWPDTTACLETMARAPESRYESTDLCRIENTVDWRNCKTAEPRRRVRIDRSSAFRGAGRTNADASAIECDGRSLSYRELDGRRIPGACLRHRGIGLDRGRSLRRALAGRAVRCWDPEGRWRLPAVGSGVSKSVGLPARGCRGRRRADSERLCDSLPRNIEHVLCLDREAAAIALESDETPVQDPTRDTLAYVIYTSGSTGSPRGVMISNWTLAAHCLDIAESFQLRPSDRVLQFASLQFDVSLEQLFPSLMLGATVVLRGPDVWHAAELRRRIAAESLTSSTCLPAWHQVVLNGRQRGKYATAVATRHRGAKRCRPSVCVNGNDVMECGKLLNAYGPTEAVITASCSRLFSTRRNSARQRSDRPSTDESDRVVSPTAAIHPGRVPASCTWEVRAGVAYLHEPPSQPRDRSDPCGTTGARLYRTRPDACCPTARSSSLAAETTAEAAWIPLEPSEIEAVLAGTLMSVRWW